MAVASSDTIWTVCEVTLCDTHKASQVFGSHSLAITGHPSKEAAEEYARELKRGKVLQWWDDRDTALRASYAGIDDVDGYCKENGLKKRSAKFEKELDRRIREKLEDPEVLDAYFEDACSGECVGTKMEVRVEPLEMVGTDGSRKRKATEDEE